MSKGCIYILANNQIFFSEDVIKEPIGVEFDTSTTVLLLVTKNKDTGKVSTEIIPAGNLLFSPTKIFIPYTAIHQILDASERDLVALRAGINGKGHATSVKEEPEPEVWNTEQEEKEEPEPEVVNTEQEEKDRMAFLSRREQYEGGGYRELSAVSRRLQRGPTTDRVRRFCSYGPSLWYELRVQPKKGAV